MRSDQQIVSKETHLYHDAIATLRRQQSMLPTTAVCHVKPPSRDYICSWLSNPSSMSGSADYSPSTTVPPAFSTPRFSASVTRYSAARSFTDPPGFILLRQRTMARSKWPLRRECRDAFEQNSDESVHKAYRYIVRFRTSSICAFHLPAW